MRRAAPTFRVILLAMITVALARAAVMLPFLPDVMPQADNDDLMRLVTVRDWLAGQDWFDTRQYRVLPPDGISLHWSRYVDAGIAAFLVPLSAVLPQPAAEMLALTLWPTLLLCLLLAVIGGTAQRLLGPVAALAAMAVALVWIRLGGFDFRPGRIDHHNVQILCSAAAACAAILPGRPVRNGLAAGAAAALSLAVGLEMLPLIVVLWVTLGLRFAARETGAHRRLAGFTAGIAGLAPLLMAGQVPVAEWGLRHCDELAPPMLALLAAGAATCLPAAAFHSRVTRPAGRLALLAVLSAGSLALVWPLVAPCLDGPYGDIAPSARAVIETRVTEARGALRQWAENPRLFLSMFGPVIVVLCAAAGLAWRARARLTAAERVALAQMLAMAAVGLAAAFYQNRLLIIAGPALAFLAGFAARELAEMAAAGRRGAAVLGVAGAVAVLAPDVFYQTGRLARATVEGPAAIQDPPRASIDSVCRTRAALAEAAALPPARILASVNMGAPLLAYTPHSVVSAPYHRGGDAFANGVQALESEAEMIAILRRTGADHVILCRAHPYGEGLAWAARLAAGAQRDWLVPADPPGQALLILRVVPEALPDALPEALPDAPPVAP